ncbi:uncharacterized protein C3orf20 homolog [Fundulus heteroclitus]|uniref:uncharacterized protein C3orf20 homolog n=1 Tax=Fundulus heteroclitus TaxID=8078 RepID=UPI00165BAFE6|nr:uncharacterized protein C3orf20 homolog [Fundulus heteroclitus]
MDAYRRAAPHLLKELAHLLSQHKWSEKDCIPRGIVNILNYSWHDLTAGASLRLRSPAAMTEEQRRSLKTGKTPRQVSAGAKEETGEGDPYIERQVKPNQCENKKKQSCSGAARSRAVRISISACGGRDPGGIAQPEQRPREEPERIRVSRWVVERLREARNPENLPPSEQDLSKAVILRHYGDGKGDLAQRRRGTSPLRLVNGMPVIPEVKLRGPVQQKLHYRINDGSSFIYYLSGCVAVCQSRSGLPNGGFYTNVFSDGQRPVTLATITPFGHGAVTHPLSSTITAVWDKEGGFMLDIYGNTTKEWRWQTFHTLRGNIVIQVSDEISVRLFSGMSGMLRFRSQNESVHLPLSFVTNKSRLKKMPYLHTGENFSSIAAQERHLLTEQTCRVPKSERSLRKTPMVKEEQQQAEPSALWRRRGIAARALQRLQQRARTVAQGWLGCYRIAVGIECPEAGRLPGARAWNRPGRAAQSAALPSLNSPERKEAAPLHAGRSRGDELRKGLSASAEKPQERLVQIQRKLNKPGRTESPVMQIGPLRIHGHIQPESVTLSHNPQSEAVPSSCGAAGMVPLAPSVPLTTCPALLRAALRGEELRRRRCCCSATRMPVVTDLEYDAFIKGQPLDSKQILVVCVTPPQQPVDTHTATRWDALEDLYRRRNKHRTMPCTQCQMDSFRLVGYQLSAGMAGSGPGSVLLQRRHSAAPGMCLMYLKGKLLFSGFIFSGDSCSVQDLQRQIIKSRRDHRLGLRLPSDHKFSDAVKTPAATEA